MEINIENFTPDEKSQFYRVIQISEQELKKNPYGFKMNEGYTGKYKTNHKIQLKQVKKRDEVIEHEEVNKFLFTKNRKSSGASFIAHIRNAYCHATILIDGNNFLIKDYTTKKGKSYLTAYGRINRMHLFPLIEFMMQDREENIKKK